MIVNLKTGEALDFAAMSDEEIVAQLKDLEEVFEMARMARDTARAVLIRRMEAEGATLKLTPFAKIRLRKQSKIRDRKLVEALYKICPPELKAKCFQMDLRPLKSGLNELAKLGDDWRQKVEAIYADTWTLNVEWITPGEIQAADELDLAEITDIPF